MSCVRKSFISAFIIFHFFVMMRVHLPLNTKFHKSIYMPVDSFLSFFSLFQTWRMFSPEPSRSNIYLTAEVDFEDGSKGTYIFPRSSELSFFDRYIYGERFRVITENIRRDDSPFLWKDAAKFAMRNLKSDHFFKIPLRVHLIRHWDIIPDVKQTFRPHLAQVSKYNRHQFYTYEVFQ